MAFLIDTNVISEMRKKAAHPKVLQWWEKAPASLIYISVLSLGEIRFGVELMRRKDPAQAVMLERWMRLARLQFEDRILPVTEEIADRWGTLGSDGKLPDVDGLIAATAMVHGLTVVTRNVADFTRSGVMVLNPWD